MTPYNIVSYTGFGTGLEWSWGKLSKTCTFGMVGDKISWYGRGCETLHNPVQPSNTNTPVRKDCFIGCCAPIAGCPA